MEILVTYKEQIILVSSFFVLPILAFIISLGSVYLFGRMLEIVKSNRGRNVVAFLAMVAVYVFYYEMIDNKSPVVDRVWRGVIYVSCSIILYVLVGFKLYDRFDDFMDRRFGRDKAGRRAKRRTTRK
jgi:uncharacterized membrane protein